jgi:3-oxoacyl-[acyl-carrier protein] reductase
MSRAKARLARGGRPSHGLNNILLTLRQAAAGLKYPFADSVEIIPPTGTARKVSQASLGCLSGACGNTMPNRIDLSGRHAVVTGGAQGIGRAIVERLLDSDAAVAIWDRDGRLAEATAGELRRNRRVGAVTVDVTRLAEVEAARDATLNAFGRIDILVNNAGIAGPNVKTWDYDPTDWSAVMRVNLDGPFHCCRAVAPLMIAQNYGRIVNVASIAGKEGNPNAPAYSASKAGVIALTKSLGKELASYDIAVNCVTPAAARTAIFDQMTQEHIDYMLSKIPRGRFVEVDEIAAMVAFCCSAECSFTTGAVFDISGGRATY